MVLSEFWHTVNGGDGMKNERRIVLFFMTVVGVSAATAQSNVTIYGRINTTVENQKIGAGSVTGLYNNASRWGIRGVEDIGGGLKAGFTLESGFNSDTGEGTPSGGLTFRRRSEVNLSGRAGVLRLGNFVPDSYYASADYVSLHNHDTGSSSDALYQDPVWFGVKGSKLPRLGTANKIAYRTPVMGGLTIDAAISLHEKAQDITQRNGYDLAANYNAGPLQLGAGFSTVDGNWQASLRGLYKFGGITLGGYYQRNDENILGSRNNIRVSAMYAFGVSEFHANIGHASKWSNSDYSAATQWTLGYNYNLNKRTKVYAYYTKINNGNGSAYGVVRAGDDLRSVAVGVRHAF